MAKCKLCKTDIPDGTEYCQDCQNKKNGKTNESYLDSLLNSVKNTSESVETNYKKKNKNNKKDNPAERVSTDVEKKVSTNANDQRTDAYVDSVSDDDDLYRVDFSDIEDFDQFDFDADLQDLDHEIVISEEDLFGSDAANLFSPNASMMHQNEVTLKSSVISEPIRQPSVDDFNELSEVALDGTVLEPDTATQNTMVEEETAPALEEDILSALGGTSEPEETVAEELSETTLENRINDENDLLQLPAEDNVIPQEIEELPEDSGLDLDLDELLNSLDLPDSNSPEKLDTEIHSAEELPSTEDNALMPDLDMFHTYTSEEPIEEMDLTAAEHSFEPVEAEDTDFLDLLSQISGDDPVSDDLKAISDLIQDPQREDKEKNMPGDVGEVFSDALTAVSSLKDFDLDGEGLMNDIPDVSGDTSDSGKEKKSKKKSAKKPGKKTGSNKEKPKGNLFQRLFGNVKDEKTAAEFEQEMKDKEAEEAGVAKPKKDKGKKKGGKNGDTSAAEETESTGRRQGKDSEEEAVPDKKKGKADKKKAKAEKKKAKEAISIIDEIDEDPGRINRMGATIVFIFFGALAAVLILGTNIISYTLNIQHAADYFSKQKYTEAYYEVYGTELRDEDLELYEKIATVMFVNKQLNSYNNYYNIREYPQALDSLLKGLKRYDKYIELATMLGVDSDLNYVREQILAELNKKFNLSEAEAVKIISITNTKDYSLAVYDVVIEKMNQ